MSVGVRVHYLDNVTMIPVLFYILHPNITSAGRRHLHNFAYVRLVSQRNSWLWLTGLALFFFKMVLIILQVTQHPCSAPPTGLWRNHENTWCYDNNTNHNSLGFKMSPLGEKKGQKKKEYVMWILKLQAGQYVEFADNRLKRADFAWRSERINQGLWFVSPST